MKKRILAFTLTLAMLLSMASIVASAADTFSFLKPLGKSANPNATELTINDMVKFTTSTKDDFEVFKSNRLKLSTITTVGMTVKDGGNLSNAFDDAWGVASGINDTYKATFTGKFYDAMGNESTSTVPTAAAPYTYLITLDLGSVQTVGAFSMVCQTGNSTIQTADIYVSENGTDWTLVHYFDRLAYTKTNSVGLNNFTDISSGSGGLSWADVNNNIATANNKRGGRLYTFDLTDVNARYVKIASTTYVLMATQGSIVGDTPGADSVYVVNQGSQGSTSTFEVGEFMLFGADEVTMSAAQTTSIANGETAYDARFVAEISDTINSASLLDTASKITFNVTSSYDNHAKALTFDVHNVYSTIMAAGEEVDAPDGKVFAMFEIKGIPVATTITFKISATVVMKDGTTITSVTKSVTLPAAA